MKTVRELYEEAFKNSLSTIPQRTYSFTQANKEGKIKKHSIKPVEFKKSLNNKFGDFDNFNRKFVDHLEGQKNIIAAFASTPISFTNAWNMKAQELNSDDVLALTKSGGHFQFNQIPSGVNSSGSGLYLTGFQRGLVKSKGAGLTKGFRHKTGGIYEKDTLNEMGVFQYETPTDSSGMMEYRFAEKLTEKLGIPLVYIITQWFKYNTKFEELNNWLYMTGVAKVASNEKHPHAPIKLQLITKEEAIKLVNNLLDAMQTKGDYRVRPPMPEHLKLGWSYSKIASDKTKRQQVIDYAIKNNLRCPGENCRHVSFKTLKSKNIHIGHRISQNWNSENTGVADVHHPYNLYLSCSECNISLGKKYPSEIDKLINEMGTIGDWLMTDMLST